MSLRAISYSEGSTLLDCQAKWDFSYGDQLAGSSLKSKETPVLLRDGRAWGRAVAAYHGTGEGDALHDDAIPALVEALEEDAAEQKEAGFYDADAHREKAAELRAMLEHYCENSELLPIDHLEQELLVPLPSRTGNGNSSRYRLQVFFDGVHVDAEGRTWLVEFKLRTQLSSLDLIASSRQIRYYAWAYRKETGTDVAGVIVDERLKAIPKPPKILQSGKPSHDKRQITTPELYERACREAGGEEPKAETVEALGARRWQQRESIFLTDTEIEEAGRELVSLGLQVQALDSHKVYPVRNPSRARCPGCFYREICNAPHDAALVDVLFDRRPPKHDREESA